MRRILFVIGLFALPLGALGAQSFLKTQWYMTPQQVYHIEGKMPDRTEGDLSSYLKTMWGYRFVYSYGFDHNKLTVIYVEADEKGMTLDSLVGILRREFGSPSLVEGFGQKILIWNIERGQIHVFSEEGSPRFVLVPSR